jgi:hypothetical protein
MQYTINLVRNLREQERIARAAKARTAGICGACFFLLVLACVHEAITIVRMEHIITQEREKVARIDEEYRKYQQTRMIVDRADVELLNQLQHSRIFWTKKLAAMAYHLPEDYWITKFGYRGTEFKVEGYGYISPEQRQLITLDWYLNRLRQDSTYNDALQFSYLNSTIRDDENNRLRVSFEYSSEKK